ncbi:MAG: MCE family protein [Nitrospira sp.]|uniref:MCE family protein n=1 Tax=Nitrospira defluvii TaxID=330214 RepID=A0ABN7LNN7_9BACT|nr:MlaD family protein [Nitrospira defluvii]MCS6327712.1 MCE family protein [Nitrospira sp.]CAE6761171.1 MCE family protein [Nitrospira defluvii]
MEPKVNYIVVGAFVLLLGLTVLGAIFWLGKTDYRGIYDRYYVYTRESVAGLSVDSTVKYRGVDVGRVKAVVLNPENPEEVRVTLDIVAGTPVKTDTQAVLVTQGLTGLVTLNLTGGTREAPPLSPDAGQAYPVIKSVPSLFGRLDGTLAKLLSDQGLANLVVHLNGLAQNASLIVDEENRTLVKHVLKDLSEVTKVLAAHSSHLDRGIQGATLAAEQAAKVTERLGTQLPAVLDRIGKSAVGLQQLTEELSRTSRSVGDMVGSSKPGVEQFTRQTLADAGLLVTELRQLTATLNRVAQQIERQPNLLVLGRSSQSKGPGE